MKSFELNEKSKVLIIIRFLLEFAFFLYLVISKTPLEIIATFLIAILSIEGYKLLGAIAVSPNQKFRNFVGLVIGVLDGVIILVTMYLTGYIHTELWLYSFVSIVLSGVEYGFFGSISESIVAMSLYVVIGSLADLSISILLIRAVSGIVLGAITSYISSREMVFEQRFNELDKRDKLTREQKSRFVSLVSHSLRTPLTSVRGYIDLLVNERVGKLTKDQKDLAQKLQSETQEIYELMEDFLTIGVLEQEQINIVFEEFDLVDLCKEIVTELMRRAEVKGVKLETAIEMEKGSFQGERSKMESAIKNIVDNAIKFTPKDGKVTISLYKDRDTYRIEVQDTGIGIPKEEIGRLFEPFGRATNVLKYNYGGSGLGLYISRLIVTAHGGRIEVESEEGVGSRFIIILPTGKLGEVIKKIAGK